jgi:hypothetical protein
LWARLVACLPVPAHNMVGRNQQSWLNTVF